MTTIGFTRPSKRLKDSVKEAEELGFEVMAAPSLEILPGEDPEFERLERSVTEGSTVVFCSSTAVEECQTRFGGSLSGLVSGSRVVSIGPATSRRLEAAGLHPDTVPEDYSSEGLVDLLKDDAKGRRVVLVRSDSGSDVLSEGLRDAGADVVDIAAYRLREAGMGNAMLHMLISLKKGRIDCMAFTSPMSASTFVARLEAQFGKEAGDGYLRAVKVAAIGEPTRRRLTELGFPPDIVPETTTFRDMLVAIRDSFPQRRSEIPLPTEGAVIPSGPLNKFEAAGHLAARRGEEVHLGVPVPYPLQRHLPAHDRQVLEDDPVHLPVPGGHLVHDLGQVPLEVDPVVAQEVPVQLDHLGIGLLPAYLLHHQVLEELEAVEAVAPYGSHRVVGDERPHLLAGVALPRARFQLHGCTSSSRYFIRPSRP